MSALDACDRRSGLGAIVPGSARFAPQREWATNFEMRSPRCITRVDEVPVATAA